MSQIGVVNTHLVPAAADFHGKHGAGEEEVGGVQGPPAPPPILLLLRLPPQEEPAFGLRCFGARLVRRGGQWPKGFGRVPFLAVVRKNATRHRRHCGRHAGCAPPM